VQALLDWHTLKTVASFKCYNLLAVFYLFAINKQMFLNRAITIFNFGKCHNYETEQHERDFRCHYKIIQKNLLGHNVSSDKGPQSTAQHFLQRSVLKGLGSKV